MCPLCFVTAWAPWALRPLRPRLLSSCLLLREHHCRPPHRHRPHLHNHPHRRHRRHRRPHPRRSPRHPIHTVNC